MKGVSRQDVVGDTLRHWDILLLRVQCFLKVARLGFYIDDTNLFNVGV